MMIRFYHMVLLGFATLILAACGQPSRPPPGLAAESAPPRERLNHLVERYWDENAALNPWYSWGGAEARFGEAPVDVIAPQSLADSLAIERGFLAELLTVDRAALDPGSKLTYDLFLRDRTLTIESFTYPRELMPINPYDSTPQRFAVMASAAERYAVSGAKDFDNWQTRALSYERWTEQAIVNLREGMRRGYTLPLVLVERMLPQLAALADDTQANVFYQSSNAPPGAAADAERTRLSLALAGVVKDRILPSYRTLHDFLQREYLPRARTSVGLSALPLGEAWYDYLVKRATGSRSTPAELHALGLSDVERLRGRVQALLAETAFPGNAQGFVDSMSQDPRFSHHGADELVNAVQDLKTQVAAATPALFSVAPHADFEIRGVERFREKTSPLLFYRRALAYGKNPAVLYVNTDLQERPTALAAQFLREAVPGHHFQLALQQERTDLPRFRRFGGDPAFIAGWGLYAAALGEELGIYRDPQTRIGLLLAELECAAGMVVDTGLHSQNWTRRQALDYLHAQMPIDDVTAANRIDRAIALPAEALACVGFSKIQELRARAQEHLGARFDPRAFHALVLEDGAIPLDMLAVKIKQWEVAAAAKMD